MYGILLFGALVFASIIALSAPGFPAETLQAFFGIAIQLNASLLIAVFVVASFLLPRLREGPREWYGLLLTLDAMNLFVGLLASTVGYVLPSIASSNARSLTLLVLVGWFLGLFLLTDGIRRSQQVRP